MPKLRLGVLVSGNGSNLQSIMESIESGYLDCEIAVVISDSPDAYALKRANKNGIPGIVINPKGFSSREDFDKEVAWTLLKYEVGLVVLAGYMRIVTSVLLSAFPMRIMNIHPALLPSFPGLHAQKKALEYGVKFSGCTVHFVDEGMDTGSIIVQAVVPVHESDSVADLSGRILKEEHRIYPHAIKLFSEGRLEVKGRRVFEIKDI